MFLKSSKSTSESTCSSGWNPAAEFNENAIWFIIIIIIVIIILNCGADGFGLELGWTWKFTCRCQSEFPESTSKSTWKLQGQLHRNKLSNWLECLRIHLWKSGCHFKVESGADSSSESTLESTLESALAPRHCCPTANLRRLSHQLQSRLDEFVSDSRSTFESASKPTWIFLLNYSV